MTSIEMKQEFLVGYDKVANLDSPGYIDSEISYFLTKAQENVILSYITADNKYRESFEETERVRKYFANLVMPSTTDTGVIKTTLATNQNGKIDENSFIYELPSDFWLSITEWLITDDTCESRKYIIPISHDEYNNASDNPFKRPNSKKAWRLDLKSLGGIQRHEVITDGTYDITQYHVRYIKKPLDIVVDEDTPLNNIDCELDVSVHRRIIDEAVKLALETSEERRLQSFTQINNK